ncbi:hypothetical protein F5Y18DRAFT_282669 [Xylariaceae sp. FL1019]|nr:hypothetical protein F5Y18DRAFT_282669 [Xylariaceae sp. FL1019]
MNAHALLTSQGWRGTGHSLNPTSDSIGLTHHILIKRNEDGAGLGSKKDHKAEAWWLNAFDQALKGIDMKSGTMKQTLKGGQLEKIVARSAANKYTGARGLYASFVRGGLMEGSVNDPAAALPTPPDSGADTPLTTESEAKHEKKRKMDAKDTASKQERCTRREEKRRKKAAKAAKAAKDALREAEERAARKVEKQRVRKAERRAAKEILKLTETRGERKARRDARRKRKEEKRRIRGIGA